jgi:hypothetical protein
MCAPRKKAKPKSTVGRVDKVDMIRQSAGSGVAALRVELGKRPTRRLSLLEHFKRLKGLELPPYLEE